MHLRNPELPERETAEGDEEIRFVEFPELNTEGLVFDEERVTRAGSMRSQQKRLGAKSQRRGVTRFRASRGLLQRRQSLKVEARIRTRREVIRTLNRVMAEKQKGEHKNLKGY